MNITDHFTKEELQRSNTAIRLGLNNICPDSLADNMAKVAGNLELIRSHFGVPVRVLSCYRSPVVNAAVGGSATSAHRFAMAADITVDDVPVIKVCEWAADNIPDYDQIIYEFGPAGWCHIGFTNGTPRKELLTAIKQGSKTVYKKGLIA